MTVHAEPLPGGIHVSRAVSFPTRNAHLMAAGFKVPSHRSVSVRLFQRNRTSWRDTGGREEGAYMIVGVSKSEICRAGNSGQSWRCSVEEEFLFQGNLRVLLLRPFTDWMRTLQIVDDNR